MNNVSLTVQELGYKRDIGYHTFMYNNSTDIRNVLIFLVEHLPKKNLFEKSSDSLGKVFQITFFVHNTLHLSRAMFIYEFVVTSDRCVSIKQKVGEELRNIFASRTKFEFSCQSPFLSVDVETGTLLPNQRIDCKPIGS